MRRRLADAPRWALSLTLGVWFTVVTTVFSALTQPRAALVPLLVGGVVGGIIFGVVMGRWSVGQRESARAAIDVPDRSTEREVVRAAGRGPVPEVPEVRAAAARLVRYRLDVAAGQRRWALPFIAVVAVLGVAYSMLCSPAFWFVPVLCVAWLVAATVQPGRMVRRLRQLEE